MGAASLPVEILCCYAHADDEWLRKLKIHLSLLQRQGLVLLWHHRLMTPGTDWAHAIDLHLETASVILLLVSADFFASDYCYGIEMKRALERQEAGEARVIPIVVRPVDWTRAPFAHLHVLPTDGKPLATWKNQEMALVDITAGIRRVVVEDLPHLPARAPCAALPPLWNIPYPRNPFFLGRERELAQIHHLLHAGQTTALSHPQAISGLGGIGKTQLALEYAYRYSQDYQAVLWARAETTDALVSSYVALATLLHLPERDAREQEITVQAIKTWLQKHRDWLLILDNADELTLLPDFLPPSLGGHLLLTTRAAATGRLAHRLEIETLGPAQGALFLLKRAGFIASGAKLSRTSPQERELALQISEELGGLPLALDQAGAYLEETGTDLANYWHLYQQHRVDLLHQRRGLVNDHPASVTTTWVLSFQRVEKKHPVAADLLRLCAFLAPDTIAEEIVMAGAPFLGSLLQPVAANALLLDQAIEALRAYSLVRRDPRGHGLSIHRLVQAVLQEELNEAERRCWAERALLAVNAAFPTSKYETWSKCERVLPHALLALHWSDTYQISRAEVGHLLHATASYLQDRTRYQEAEPLYQRALHIWNQQLGSDHSEMAYPLNGLADLYYEQGKYAQAEQLYRQAVLLQEEQLGPDHLDVAYPLTGLARLYSVQGKYTEAEPLYQRALRIREEQLGPDHPLVAYPLNGLANLYTDQGKYVQAERLNQRALSLFEQQLGPDHPLVAYSLNNLAIIYHEQGKYYKQGKYTEAEPLYQRALRIREDQLGLDHPEIATSLNNLANLYRDQGKYAEAEPLYQRTLCIYEQQWESNHPDMAYPLSNLASLYKDQGKYAEAEPLYCQAVRIREEQLGPSHPLVAYPLKGLANLYSEQGNYVEAEPLYQRALYIYKQALGPHHPKTRETRMRLIALLHATGQHEQAVQLEAVQTES